MLAKVIVWGEFCHLGARNSLYLPPPGCHHLIGFQPDSLARKFICPGLFIHGDNSHSFSTGEAFQLRKIVFGIRRGIQAPACADSHKLKPSRFNYEGRNQESNGATCDVSSKHPPRSKLKRGTVEESSGCQIVSCNSRESSNWFRGGVQISISKRVFPSPPY